MHYTYVDYPKLPQDLEALCLDIDNLQPVFWPPAKNTKTAEVNPGAKYAKYRQYYLPQSVANWLLDHSIVNAQRPVALVHAMFDGDQIWPHMDYPRTQALNYVLTQDNSTTCFYRHRICPDIKPTEANSVLDSAELELVESVILDSRRWHVLQVDKIHNVTNITSARIAITVSNQLGPENLLVYRS